MEAEEVELVDGGDAWVEAKRIQGWRKGRPEEEEFPYLLPDQVFTQSLDIQALPWHVPNQFECLLPAK